MIKSKVISLRLPEEDEHFIEAVRGPLLPGEAVKNIIRYLRQFDMKYTRSILQEITRNG